MQALKQSVLTLLLVFSVAACSYDNLEEYYNEISCDTLDVTFVGTIYPIIERNCLGCHYNGNSTGVELETYNDIKSLVDNGRLIGAIHHDPGFSPMPQGGKLDNCTLLKFDIWVADGALYNQ